VRGGEGRGGVSVGVGGLNEAHFLECPGFGGS
jgi:hypothetical protein